MGENKLPGIRETVRTMAREEGLLTGISFAAIMHSILQKDGEMNEDKTIVAVPPDSGEKYLSINLFE